MKVQKLKKNIYQPLMVLGIFDILLKSLPWWENLSEPPFFHGEKPMVSGEHFLFKGNTFPTSSCLSIDHLGACSRCINLACW